MYSPKGFHECLIRALQSFIGSENESDITRRKKEEISLTKSRSEKKF